VSGAPFRFDSLHFASFGLLSAWLVVVGGEVRLVGKTDPKSTPQQWWRW
jgi:hypothetical protein